MKLLIWSCDFCKKDIKSVEMYFGDMLQYYRIIETQDNDHKNSVDICPDCHHQIIKIIRERKAAMA